MISSIISRLVILLFGTLYPAYASYKAVKTKNVKEYVKWMMYWIVFALFTCTETFTDIFLSWFPFYYEIKIILVIWLLSPATKGSSILYRKFVHPMLSSREQEIDEYISKAKEQSYRQVLDLGQKGVTVLMQTAIKGGGGIVNQLKKSYSLSDLSDPTNDGNDEIDDVLVTDPRLVRRRKAGRSPHRSSSASSASVYFSEVDVSTSVVSGSGRVTEVRSIEDISSGYSSGEGLYAQHPLKLQARDSIATQRTNSLTRARSTRVTRSHVPKKTSGMSDDSDENEVFDTNIIFLNDKIKKIDKFTDKLTDKPESSSSETEFYDIPESNPLHVHGKPFEKEKPSSSNKHSDCNLILYRNETIIDYNNPESLTDALSSRANNPPYPTDSGYGDQNKVTACKSDFSSSLSFNLTKLSNALSSLYPHSIPPPSRSVKAIEDNNIGQLKETNRKPGSAEQDNFEGNYSKPEFKEKAQQLDVYKQNKPLNLAASTILNEEVSGLSNLDVRGGKYNKKHAPLPPNHPKTDSSNVNPIKATLVLQPGIVRSLSRSTDNIATKEMFFNCSPKARRKSRRRSPTPSSLRSTDSNSSSKIEQAFNKVLKFPRKMVHLNIPERVREKRNSWSGFFNAGKLGGTKVQSRSTSNLENRDVQTIDGAVMKRTGSQMSVKSLSASPLAYRRLKIIRRYVDSDID